MEASRWSARLLLHGRWKITLIFTSQVQAPSKHESFVKSEGYLCMRFGSVSLLYTASFEASLRVNTLPFLREYPSDELIVSSEVQVNLSQAKFECENKSQVWMGLESVKPSLEQVLRTNQESIPNFRAKESNRVEGMSRVYLNRIHSSESGSIKSQIWV